MSRAQTMAGPEARSLFRGIAYVLLAISFLPMLNGTAKYLAADYPTAQVVWARYAGQLVYMVALFAPRYGTALFRTAHPAIQVARSFLLLGSTGFAFFALKFVPLTTFTTINFTAPLMVTALAMPVLGEAVGPRRWSAVVAGFAGALIVLRPGLEGTHPAAFLVLLGAACYAFYQLLTRKIAGRDSPIVTAAYTAVVGTLVVSLVLPFAWKAPADATAMALFLALGALAGLGHFCLIMAYQHLPAPVIAPFLYGPLLWATLIDHVVFGTVPDGLTRLGAAIIVGSGLYISLREGRLVRRRKE